MNAAMLGGETTHHHLSARRLYRNLHR